MAPDSLLTPNLDRISSLENELKLAQEGLAQLEKRIEGELQAAAAIQRAFLPAQTPLMKGLRSTWRYRPSCHLGGDSLNVFTLDERHIGFYILDVSGHGLAASLLSVAISHFLSPFSSLSFLRDPGSRFSVAPPSDVAGRLNLQFASNPEIAQFFTFFYGVLDTTSLEMVYASAGHPSPILFSQGAHTLLNSTGMPVGVDAGADYDNHVVQLKKGDRLYLYSDGVSEARSPSGELFGEERLIELVGSSMSSALHDSLDVIQDTVNTWCNPSTPDDDVSLLALETF